jgi:hypothetical protein
MKQTDASKNVFDIINPKLLAQFFLFGIPQGLLSKFSSYRPNSFNLEHNALVNLSNKDQLNLILLVGDAALLAYTKNIPQAAGSISLMALGHIIGELMYDFFTTLMPNPYER